MVGPGCLEMSCRRQAIQLADQQRLFVLRLQLVWHERTNRHKVTRPRRALCLQRVVSAPSGRAGIGSCQSGRDDGDWRWICRRERRDCGWHGSAMANLRAGRLFGQHSKGLCAASRGSQRGLLRRPRRSADVEIPFCRHQRRGPGPLEPRSSATSRKTRALRFKPRRLFYPHADLRIPLREMRARQRNPGSLDRLEGHHLSALRLGETGQETFRFRLRQRRRQPCAVRKQRRRSLLQRRLSLPWIPPLNRYLVEPLNREA